jgi:thioredoxin 1
LGEVHKPQSIAQLTELMNNNDELVVNFSKSVGCVYCTRLKPHFVKAAEKSEKTFVEIDVLEVPDAINAYGIQSVPTVLHFKKGEPTATLTGRTSVKLLSELA